MEPTNNGTPDSSPLIGPAELKCLGCGATAGPTLKPGDTCGACGGVVESVPHLIDPATREQLAAGEVPFTMPQRLSAESAVVSQVAGRIFVAAVTRHDYELSCLSATPTPGAEALAEKYIERAVAIAAKIVAAAGRAVVA